MSELTIVDDQGRPRIRLEVTTAGAVVALMDAEGKPRQLLLQQEAGGRLAILGKGNSALFLSAEGGDSPNTLISLRSATREGRIEVDEFRPGLTIEDSRPNAAMKACFGTAVADESDDTADSAAKALEQLRGGEQRSLPTRPKREGKTADELLQLCLAERRAAKTDGSIFLGFEAGSGRVSVESQCGSLGIRTCGPDGPGFVVNDREGKERAVLGGVQTVMKASGVESTFPPSTLTLFSQDGTVLLQVPR